MCRYGAFAPSTPSFFNSNWNLDETTTVPYSVHFSHNYILVDMTKIEVHSPEGRELKKKAISSESKEVKSWRLFNYFFSLLSDTQNSSFIPLPCLHILATSWQWLAQEYSACSVTSTLQTSLRESLSPSMSSFLGPMQKKPRYGQSLHFAFLITDCTSAWQRWVQGRLRMWECAEQSNPI